MSVREREVDIGERQRERERYIEINSVCEREREGRER